MLEFNSNPETSLSKGPRLRDKISHGEVDLDEEMTNNIFRMCIYIIMASYNDLEQYLNSDTSCNSLANPSTCINDYSAIFHPKKLMIEDVDDVIIGELYENFVRKGTLVKYQSQSEVIKVML